MKGVKAVYETLLAGPVKVRALAIYSTCNGRPSEVLCRVTSKNNRTYPTGLLVLAPTPYLWEKHRYMGKFGSINCWEGRPVLSGLPKADNTLLQELCKQTRYL